MYTYRFAGSIRELIKNKGLEFYLSKSNATILYTTIPAESDVKVVKRNKGDLQGEILDQKNDLVR